MRLLLLLLLSLSFTADAALFRHVKDTPEQKKLKAQAFPFKCSECRETFALHPKRVFSTGGHMDTNTHLSILEYQLSAQCPKCKTELRARHDVSQEPLPFVAPLPTEPPKPSKHAITQSPKAKASRTEKLVTPLPPVPKPIVWTR